MDLTPAQSEADPIAARLRLILRGLLAVFGNWRAMEPALTVPFHRRISHMHLRLERLWLRFRAGRLRPATLRVVTPRAGGSRKPYTLLPRKWGWLLEGGKHHAAYFTHQLHDLLTSPDMAALLEAAPQAKAMLRPLCRALAVELPWTVTPPRPPKPRKPRAPRPAPEPFRIPLPRGVLTWARREKALEKAKMRLR